MKIIITYECNFCGEQDIDREYIERHERKYEDNPKNRLCPSCVSFENSEDFYRCKINLNIRKTMRGCHCNEWKPKD